MQEKIQWTIVSARKRYYNGVPSVHPDGVGIPGQLIQGRRGERVAERFVPDQGWTLYPVERLISNAKANIRRKLRTN